MPANNSDKCATIMVALERELGGKPAAESSSKLLLRTTADPEWVCCTVELFSSVENSPKQVEVQEDNNTSLLFDYTLKHSAQSWSEQQLTHSGGLLPQGALLSTNYQHRGGNATKTNRLLGSQLIKLIWCKR